MTARDVLARALFYEFTADPEDDNPPSWHAIPETYREGWRRVADYLARMDGEKFDEPTKPALYVNHDRTEPVPGDVVRDADNPEWNGWLYLRSDNGRWLDSSRGEWFEKAMPTRLRLLVDGETGQVVP